MQYCNTQTQKDFLILKQTPPSKAKEKKKNLSIHEILQQNKTLEVQIESDVEMVFLNSNKIGAIRCVVGFVFCGLIDIG